MTACKFHNCDEGVSGGKAFYCLREKVYLSKPCKAANDLLDRAVKAIEDGFDRAVRTRFADLGANLAGGEVSKDALEHFANGMRLELKCREFALEAARKILGDGDEAAAGRLGS